MNQKEIKILLQRYRMGLCSPEEAKKVQRWYDELAGEDFYWTEEQKEHFEQDLHAKIMGAVEKDKTKHRKKLVFRIAAAASLLFLIGLGSFLLFQNDKRVPVKTVADANPYQNILPGGNKAVLTLSDGTKVALDSVSNGRLARQGNAQVVKVGKGKLTYQNTGEDVTAVVYNTLHTPKGGRYRLILPDGTKVWLNAASTLRYPTAFTDKERRVEISGEAYFKVAPDASRPFRAQVKTSSGRGCLVDVLGTEFNVHAYDQEQGISTTLIKGSIKVTRGAKEVVIRPGRQALIKNEQIHIMTVDTTEVTAWKNGLFIFNGKDIQTIMRQVARWYNLQVVYDNPPVEKFYVNIPRDTKLSSLFKMLESTEAVHFKLTGRKVTVTR